MELSSRARSNALYLYLSIYHYGRIDKNNNIVMKKYEEKHCDSHTHGRSRPSLRRRTCNVQVRAGGRAEGLSAGQGREWVVLSRGSCRANVADKASGPGLSGRRAKGSAVVINGVYMCRESGNARH